MFDKIINIKLNLFLIDKNKIYIRIFKIFYNILIIFFFSLQNLFLTKKFLFILIHYEKIF
jgi:hypothetical protein